MKVIVDLESDGMGLNRLFNKKIIISLLTLLLLTAGTGCTAPAGQQADNDGRLKVVATTTIVGDVVARVGADHVALDVLLPVGADPHTYDPAPRDVVMIADADVVFASGLGLETFLDTLIENAGAAGRVVQVSEGIAFTELIEKSADEHEGDADTHQDESRDPHTWTDPNLVMVWVEVMAARLSDLDPAHAGDYAANAAAYQVELSTLDTWVRQQVDQIPEAERLIVADHTQYSYFAARYGFTQVGAIIPGYSTLAEPSVKEMAALQDAVALLGVKAIFVGSDTNPALAERMAEDTGIKVVTLYTGSLTAADGEAPTYIDYIRYNVGAIVEALR
jgi:ABC-type Zn uptake system ZnuABC Zn-binding protein ZnuA